MNVFTELRDWFKKRKNNLKDLVKSTRIYRLIKTYENTFASLFGFFVSSMLALFSSSNLYIFYSGLFLASSFLGIYVNRYMEGEKEKKCDEELKLGILYISAAWGTNYFGIPLVGIIPLGMIIVQIIYFYYTVYPSFSR